MLRDAARFAARFAGYPSCLSAPGGCHNHYCLFHYICIWLYMSVCNEISVWIKTNQSICLSVYLTIYLSIYPSIYLSTHYQHSMISRKKYIGPVDRWPFDDDYIMSWKSPSYPVHNRRYDMFWQLENHLQCFLIWFCLKMGYFQNLMVYPIFPSNTGPFRIYPYTLCLYDAYGCKFCSSATSNNHRFHCRNGDDHWYHHHHHDYSDYLYITASKTPFVSESFWG